MNEKEEYLTARKELEKIQFKIAKRLDEIRREYFPEEILDEYLELLNQYDENKDSLRNSTDDEFERIRYWVRGGGLERCPRNTEGLKQLDELCKDIDCPEYDKECWATKSFIPPTYAVPQWLLEFERREVQKDWSEERKKAWERGEPTPLFEEEKDEDKEDEKEDGFK